MNAGARRTWGARARVGAWVHFGLQIFFLLTFLVLANLLAGKVGGRFDLTSRRSFGLDPVTEDALRRLDYDLEVWLTPWEFALNTGDDKSLRVAWARTVDLLEEFRKRTGRFKVTYINPLDRGEAARLMRHWPQVVPNTLYLLATHGPDRVNKKTVDLMQLYEGDPKTGTIVAYRGEAVLLQALRELAVSTKRVVYETFGHKEILSEDPRAMALLVQHLGSHEGVEFRRVDTAGNMRVPEEARMVAVLGPAAAFQPPEVEILREYLERGGSLFVALRPRVESGLEKFLEDYGVRVNPVVIIHDPIDCVPPRMSHLRVRRFNDHPVNRVMAGAFLTMPDSCTVEPLEKGAGWKTIPLAQSGPESWGEKGPVGPDDRPRPDKDERRGPLDLIVAVEKDLPGTGGGPPRKAKLVVWGSVHPLTNSGLSPGGHVNTFQLHYIVNTFRWLMDRDPLEIGTRPVRIDPLQMSPRELDQVWWISGVGFPMVGVILGVMAYLFRRK